MADIPSPGSFTKLNNVEIATNATISEALNFKYGQQINRLIDQDAVKTGDLTTLTTRVASLENNSDVTFYSTAQSLAPGASITFGTVTSFTSYQPILFFTQYVPYTDQDLNQFINDLPSLSGQRLVKIDKTSGSGGAICELKIVDSLNAETVIASATADDANDIFLPTVKNPIMFNPAVSGDYRYRLTNTSGTVTVSLGVVPNSNFTIHSVVLN